VQVQFLSAIQNIDASVWNSVVKDSNPFIQHDFLQALEASGCVSAATGWQPHHLIVTQADAVVAIMPLYLKSHSYGEYIFDFSWARAYEHYGLPYYPKLLSAIPFVPATGSRLCCVDSINKAEVIHFVSSALKQTMTDSAISSAHILLSGADESAVWDQYGFAKKIGTQFHWLQQVYEDFDAFLASFNSRKRKAVKKERLSIQQAGITTEKILGSQMNAHLWDTYFNFYRDTYQKRSGHDGYLNREFFNQLSESLLAKTLVVFAKRDDHYIAGALYFFSDTTLYGRHWGASEHVEMLHFELCYYAGIDFCLEKGLQKFEAGAQGEHKIQRGFIPSEIYSNHWVTDERFRPAIQQHIREESQGNLQYIEEMKSFLPFRQLE
jgi:uncharacterized protein